MAALFFIYTWFRDDAENVARLLFADPSLLVAAAFSHIAYFVVTVLAWCAILHLGSELRISFGEGLSQILLVNFGKYIPGKIWGIAARGTRLKALGYSFQEITRASYFEQMLLLLTGFWLAFLSAFIVFGQSLYLGLLLVASILLILMKLGGAIIEWLVGIIPSTEPVLRFIDVKLDAARFTALTCGYLLLWLFLSASFTLVSIAILPIEVTVHTIAVFVLSLTTGYLAGFVAVFAPGGIGVREGVGASILTTLVPLQDAVMLMLLFRIWVVLWELIAGGSLIIRRRNEVADSHVD